MQNFDLYGCWATQKCVEYAHFNDIFVFSVYYTELEINFQESDYIVDEDDHGGSIVLQLSEVQNSFTMTLYPVSITEARDPAGRFNVSAFIASVPEDAQATPGKGIVPSQTYMLTLTEIEKHV